MNFNDMTYEQVIEYVEKLLDIHPDNLDSEALRGTRIFTELNRLYITRSRKLRDLLNAQAKLEHKRKRYYNGKETSDVYKKEPLTEAILKSDIDSYMAIDHLVVEMRNLVSEEDKLVKFLEDTKGQLRSRGFDIKNAIDYRKLMLGA